MGALMRRLVTRAANIGLRPESKWIAIAHERSAWLEVCWRYLAPLALISPLAYGCSVLIGGESAFRQFTNCMFLFYLGLHHIVKVPRCDAAECTAIVVAAGIMLSSVVGYYGSAAGLFPHM